MLLLQLLFPVRVSMLTWIFSAVCRKRRGCPVIGRPSLLKCTFLFLLVSVGNGVVWLIRGHSFRCAPRRCAVLWLAVSTFSAQFSEARSIAKNKQFARHWDKQLDAFRQDWSCLPLWNQHPFSVLSKVVGKLVSDSARAVAVVPKWQEWLGLHHWIFGISRRTFVIFEGKRTRFACASLGDAYLCCWRLLSGERQLCFDRRFFCEVVAYGASWFFRFVYKPVFGHSFDSRWCPWRWPLFPIGCEVYVDIPELLIGSRAFHVSCQNIFDKPQSVIDWWFWRSGHHRDCHVNAHVSAPMLERCRLVTARSGFSCHIRVSGK